MDEEINPDSAAIPPLPPDLQARIFRAKGMDVYPGKILVLRGGSWGLQAIEDEQFDCNIEHLVGVSLWGPLPKFVSGTVLLEPKDMNLFCIPLIGDSDRKPLCIPLLDTWIARADALRKLIQGTASTYGPIPLSDEQIFAGAKEIYKAIRERAAILIKKMPSGQDEVTFALARIVDASDPSAEMLTDAIVNLVTTIPTWSIQGRDDLSMALAGSFPVERELREAANVTNKIFRQIRKDAGIVHGLYGHAAAKRQYPPDEVARMMHVVKKGSFRDRDLILQNWAPFSVSSTP